MAFVSTTKALGLGTEMVICGKFPVAYYPSKDVATYLSRSVFTASLQCDFSIINAYNYLSQYKLLLQILMLCN